MTGVTFEWKGRISIRTCSATFLGGRGGEVWNVYLALRDLGAGGGEAVLFIGSGGIPNGAWLVLIRLATGAKAQT